MRRSSLRQTVSYGISKIYCRNLLTLSNQKSLYKTKCIRIQSCRSELGVTVSVKKLISTLCTFETPIKNSVDSDQLAVDESQLIMINTVFHRHYESIMVMKLYQHIHRPHTFQASAGFQAFTF